MIKKHFWIEVLATGVRIPILPLLFLTIIACNNPAEKSNPDPEHVLSLLAEFDLDIIEPSDLFFDAPTKTLLTVSDSKSKIYTISTKGKIISDIKIALANLEGVCLGKDQSLCVVDELSRSVARIDEQGNTLSQHAIAVVNTDDNNGLEGISYASCNDHYYIVNEQNPDLLIETDSKFTVLATYELSFASDYSGICVDNSTKSLWIVSDISETVTQCDLQGKPIVTYRIPVKNAEGVAYDPAEKKLYIVSDSKSKLYVFTLEII